MEVGRILETGYVIYAPERNDHYTANAGLFKTKVNAQKQCDRHNKIYKTQWKVLKVELVVVEV